MLFVHVKDDDADAAAALIAQVVDTVHQHGGTVLHIISAIVIGLFDSDGGMSVKSALECSLTADAIHRRLGQNAKVLYGLCRALRGNFGSTTRVNVGPFIPGVSEILERLRRLDFGTCGDLADP